MSGTPATEDDGKDRVTAAFYDGRSVNVETLHSMDSVSEYLKIHSGAQVWIDVRTDTIKDALGRLDVDDPGSGPVVHEVDDPLLTVIAYSHTVPGSRRIHRTVLVTSGTDVLFTVHDSKGGRDSKQNMLEYMPALVKKELADVPKAIIYFREMLIAALLDSQGDEYIATLQHIVRDLSALHQRLDRGETATREVQSEIFKVHMFIEDEFPTALLSFREVVAKLRMGAGKNMDLSSRHHELEETLRDVDGAVGIKANVEKTIDLINNTVHMRLTERTLESQRRLQLAVWWLTHLSVLLIIPNLVLGFWRLTPWIEDHTFRLGSVEIHSFWMALVMCVVFSLVALVVLNMFLRRRLGIQFGEVVDRSEGGDIGSSQE